MSDLKNKNIIVTGASGGIGNSIVRKLCERGANILASGTKLEKLEKLKSENKNIRILKFDISEIEKIVDEKKDLGPLLLAQEKFNFIIKNYPNSDYALDANYKLDLI